MPTVLITGFGPFPGAPFNPTVSLVNRLARIRRPALADVTIVTHIFQTSYAAVDHDLPALIARHNPDAILMFGLATRTRHIRIETRARNALARMPDATSTTLARHVIAPSKPAALVLPAPAQRLLAAARAARVKAGLSRDVGRYLCNYLCWHAAQTTATPMGPRLATFIHVSLVRRHARPRTTRNHRLTMADLIRAGECLLVEMVAASRR